MSQPERAPLRLAPPVVAACAVVLGWALTYRVASNPLKWEEPRRCLVAMEMMYSGNFVTPRILSEPYVKKPPLHNWLVALAAGFDPARVGPLAARAVSLAALAGSCLILWGLGTDGVRPRRGALPAVIFATFGTVFQHARAGEIDTLFCFFVLASVALYEAGRRRGSGGMRWGASQAMLAAGVLTKWIAPLFFYPPLLWHAVRHRTRPPALPVLVGLAGATLLVALWYVPFTLGNPASGLEQRFWSEIATRTTGRGFAGWALHLATYPVLVISALLPWSLWLVSVPLGARGRERLARLGADPWIALSAAIVGWTLVVFAFVPEQKARYLMPAFPFVAVLLARLVEERSSWFSVRRTRIQRLGRHPLAWALAAAAWIPLARSVEGSVWAPALAGAAVLAGAGVWFARQRDAELPAAPLLVLGLLYAVAYAGESEVAEARRNAPFASTAERFAQAIGDERPVVMDRRVSLKLAQPLTRRLGRPLARRAPPGAAAWWIGPPGTSVTGAEPVLRGASAELWQLEPPEAWSAQATPLFAPALPDELRAEREAALAAARAAAAAAPGQIDAQIWLGRRTAYLGRYREAIAIFGQALESHPADPRLLRHRGHRYLTVRRFDEAIADLGLAARVLEGRPDEVEPDGLPNARGIPTSTLYTNVWYHLGLAHYLRGELAEAERCFRRSVTLCANDDMLSAASHWLWTTLSRRGKTREAAQLLEPIHAGMEILENHAYHRLLLLYRGGESPEELLAWAESTGETAFATAGYGVANWHWVEGRRTQAIELWARIVARGEWPAFGHLAAEQDLARVGDRAL